MKIAIAVHGGASSDSPWLQHHAEQSKEGLSIACKAGYDILKTGGTALDAVTESVKLLEDNRYFNAGRGSALNANGEVEMDAAIMNGQNLQAGAVSMIQHVKNPILLARTIMEQTHHVFLSGYGAWELAKKAKLTFKPDSYFITPHQYEMFEELSETESFEEILTKKIHGTVGAVALDAKGNLAAGTSTGGTSNCLPGRVGDSCIIGAGCYASNNTCAVSGTGEGEYLIRGVIAHTISMMCEYGLSLKEACHKVLHERNKAKGEIGVISVNSQGDVAIAFNTEIMKRAWIGPDQKLHVKTAG